MAVGNSRLLEVVFLTVLGSGLLAFCRSCLPNRSTLARFGSSISDGATLFARDEVTDMTSSSSIAGLEGCILTGVTGGARS